MAAWRDVMTDVVPVLASTFASIFYNNVNDRSLLGEIVKHWLTMLVEETHVNQQTVGWF